MKKQKHLPISVHSTLHGEINVNWEIEYNRDFYCPYCSSRHLRYRYRKGIKCNLELTCTCCQKVIRLTCSIKTKQINQPVSIHDTLSSKLVVIWHTDYKCEFRCPVCNSKTLMPHFLRGQGVLLDCNSCQQTTLLSCAISNKNRKYLPVSTHQTLNGVLHVNWYLEYNNEFSCPKCNHNHLVYCSRHDKSCNLVLECSSCKKATHLCHQIPGAGKEYAPISIHQTLHGKLEVNWYLEYKDEFSCPHCGYESITYSHDKTKATGLRFECGSCNRNFALTQRVPSHISNYEPSIECPNPSCKSIGHDGQKGWIYKIRSDKSDYKCYFCKIIFNPNSTHACSWINSQKEELSTFSFDIDCWDVKYFGYDNQNIKRIYFDEIRPNWYTSYVKQYIYFLLNSHSISISAIYRKLLTLKQFGQILMQQQVNNLSEITRRILLSYFDSRKMDKGNTFHDKISSIKDFFDWLNLDSDLLIRHRDFPKLSTNDPEWLDEITRKAIKSHLHKIPKPISCYYLVQEYTAARPKDIALINCDCLIKEDDNWYIKFFQHKIRRWHKILASREIREVIEEQQQWIREILGTDYNYLFCHFRLINKKSYPSFSRIKPLSKPPLISASKNPMVRIIKMLIEKENILDANGQKPNFTGKIIRSSRLQEVRVKYGMEAAQLYADHKKKTTTFQHYAPPTREQIAEVDLPFQELLMNPLNKFLPWQSLPESLLKNPKAHELDLEIAPRLVVYGHCALDPKTPCPVNLFPKCYGCSSFRPSTSKLPLYERQYQGEKQRLAEAEKIEAELAVEEAKATIEAMDKWLPELKRLTDE